MGKGATQHPGFDAIAHQGHPIHIKASHKGLLHAKLGVPQGQPIPAAKIAKAKQSASPALRKEANFAANAKKFKH